MATPVARRTAVELGVSLHGLAGTGPGGRITVEDVTRAAADLDGLEREVTEELERMRENGLAAPFPSELTAREFKD